MNIPCNKCGKELDGAIFDYNNYEYDWFNISFSDSFSEEECGSGKAFKMNLCEPCSELLIELVKLNGFKVNEKLCDW